VRAERQLERDAAELGRLGAGASVSVESSPYEIASALVELLTQPQFGEAAERAAAAIAAVMPDETAAAALSGFAHLARRLDTPTSS
jgi:UDP:flavonoid glycosyltransferase YjiC (YdhE family)